MFNTHEKYLLEDIENIKKEISIIEDEKDIMLNKIKYNMIYSDDESKKNEINYIPNYIDIEELIKEIINREYTQIIYGYKNELKELNRRAKIEENIKRASSIQISKKLNIKNIDEAIKTTLWDEEVLSNIIRVIFKNYDCDMICEHKDNYYYIYFKNLPRFTYEFSFNKRKDMEEFIFRKLKQSEFDYKSSNGEIQHKKIYELNGKLIVKKNKLDWRI